VPRSRREIANSWRTLLLDPAPECRCPHPAPCLRRIGSELPVSAERFRQIFNLLETTIEERIPITTRDVAQPFTGDPDGARIELDYDLPIGEAVFILLHLFGHARGQFLRDSPSPSADGRTYALKRRRRAATDSILPMSRSAGWIEHEIGVGM